MAYRGNYKLEKWCLVRVNRGFYRARECFCLAVSAFAVQWRAMVLPIDTSTLTPVKAVRLLLEVGDGWCYI